MSLAPSGTHTAQGWFWAAKSFFNAATQPFG
jgi:hypothetical protein